MRAFVEWAAMVDFVSLVLAITVPLVVVLGYLNRRGSEDNETKGIGWQFIRYTVIGMAIPVAGILALNGALTEATAAIIAGALGYAFGQRDN